MLDVASDLAVTLRFDLLNPLAVQAAQQRAGAMVVQASAAQVQSIRNAVSAGLLRGSHPSRIAKDIKEVMGLHPKWATAVTNFREAEIKRALGRGHSLRNAQRIADGKATRYHRRLVGKRATAIARTEVQAAVTNGQRLAWDQAVERGNLDPAFTRRHWILNPNQLKRDICSEQTAADVPLQGEFPAGDPPLHTHCVCTTTLVFIDEDLAKPLPDPDDQSTLTRAATDDELDAVLDYKMTSEVINPDLRQGGQLVGRKAEIRNGMDSLLNDARLSQDITLYRGGVFDRVTVDGFKKKGVNILDKGYSSLSSNQRAARQYIGLGRASNLDDPVAVVFKMKAKEGQGILRLRDVMPEDLEQEFILGRATTMVTTGKTRLVDGVLEVETTFLGKADFFAGR